MLHERCLCPRCGTTLRVKDRGYLNRPVPCPSCRTVLLIQETEVSRLSVTIADEQPAPLPAAGQLSLPERAAWPPWVSNITVASWLATFAVATMIGLAFFWPRRTAPQPVPQAQIESAIPPVEVDPVEQLPLDPPEDVPVVAADPDPMPEVPQAPPLPELDEPLEALVTAEPEPTVPVPPIPIAVAELPPIDFEPRLAQPLKGFRQEKSATRRELLDLLEEMIGAPIRMDAEDLGDLAKRLDQAVSLEFQDITVGELLDRLLEKTELTYDRERDGLRLRRAGAPE